MGMSKFLPPLLLMLLCAGCDSMKPSNTIRELSNFKVNQRPTVIGEDLPYEWAKELAIKLVGAPAIDLKDSDTIDLVVKMFSEVSWIDSRSVKVALALPEGLRVTYKSRIPVLSLAVGEQYLGLLSLDGYMLPEGFSKSQLDKFIKIVVEKTTKIPAVGDRVSAPLLQEASRCFPIIDQLKVLAGINFTHIARQSDYGVQEDKVSPALSFLTDDGVEVQWGRSAETPDPFSVDRDGKALTLERKGQRLALVLIQFPGLGGLGTVVLDDPLVKVFNRKGEMLQLSPDIF